MNIGKMMNIGKIFKPPSFLPMRKLGSDFILERITPVSLRFPNDQKSAKKIKMGTSVSHSSLSCGTRPNLQQTQAQTEAEEEEEAEEEARRIFEEWMVEYEKSYSDMEEKEKRFKTFKHKLKKIEKHNSDPNQSYKIGLNLFSDITHDEYLEKYGNRCL